MHRRRKRGVKNSYANVILIALIIVIILLFFLFFIFPKLEVLKAPIDETICPTKIVSYWDFDVSSLKEGGILYDHSGNARTGLLTSGDTTNKIVAGVVEKALSFDGVDDFLKISDSNDEALDIGTKDMQFSVWFKADELRNQIVFEKAEASDTYLLGYRLSLHDGGSITFGLGDGNNRVEIRFGVYEVGKWYNVIVVIDDLNDQILFYINGQPAAVIQYHLNGILTDIPTRSGMPSNAIVYPFTTPIGVLRPLYLGAEGVYKKSYFKGAIDEFAIFRNGQFTKDNVESVYGKNCSLPILIDNVDYKFSKVGTWSLSGTNNQFGIDSRYSKTVGDTATWSFDVESPGTYSLDIWWSNGPTIKRSKLVRYNLYNGNSKLDSWTVDQTLNGGKFIRRGDYNFKKGNVKLVLNVEDSTGSNSADAVKFSQLAMKCDSVQEICNGIDDDCNGEIDDSCGVTPPPIIKELICGGDGHPQGYWSFNESVMVDGSILPDNSGNKRNFVLTTGDTSNRAVSGVSGNAVSFDGNNDYASLVHDPEFNIRTGSMEFSVWFKADEMRDQILFEKGVVASGTSFVKNGYHLLLADGGSILFGYGDGTQYLEIRFGEAYEAGKWYHAVIVVDDINNQVLFYLNGQPAQVMIYYVNGIQQTSIPSINGKLNIVPLDVPGSIGDSSPLILGKEDDGNRFFFKGALDEFALFTKPTMRDEEVKILYDSKQVLCEKRFCENPDSRISGYWRFNEHPQLLGGIVIDDSKEINTGYFLPDVDADKAVLALREYGLSFDGNGDYVHIDHRDVLNIGTKAMTLTTWFKADELRNQIVFEKGTIVSGPVLINGYYLRLNNGGNIYFGYGDGTQYREIKFGEAYEAGKWYHAVIVVDDINDEVLFYLNGQPAVITDYWENNVQKLISSVSGKPNAVPLNVPESIGDSSPLIFGKEDDGNRFFFKGVLDDMVFFKAALNLSDVNNLYDNGEGNPACNLISNSVSICVADIDKDGYGEGCANGPDCNEGDPAIHALVTCAYNGNACISSQQCTANCPAVPTQERCGNGKDDDCNGESEENCPTEERAIIDNLDSGFSSSGKWSNSSSTGSYGINSLYSKTVGDSATWNINLPSGKYKIFAWWTYANLRAKNALYSIYNINKNGEIILINSIRVNQNDINLADKWNQLGGEYSLDGEVKVSLIVENQSNSYNADTISFIKIGESSCQPSDEICGDGKDNDCDGQVDENKKSFYPDNDKDTFGYGKAVEACEAPENHVENNLDCNDEDADLKELKKCVYTNQLCGDYSLCTKECPVPPPENCRNLVDENCDGKIDVCPLEKPILDIREPKNQTYINKIVSLDFKAEGASNCWYILDGTKKNAECNKIIELDLKVGQHNITIFANNTIGQAKGTIIFNIRKDRRVIVNYGEFYGKGDTTNLDDMTDDELMDVSLVLHIPNYGKIEFLKNIDLTKNTNKITNVTDINGAVNISFNRIEVKANVLSALNVKSRLTLEKISFKNPRILKGGIACTNCKIENYSNGKIIFEVPGFSVYSVEETPKPSEGDNEGDDDGYDGGDKSKTNNESKKRNVDVLGDEDILRKDVFSGDIIYLEVDNQEYDLFFEIENKKGYVFVEGVKYSIFDNKITKIHFGDKSGYITALKIDEESAEVLIGLNKEAIEKELDSNTGRSSIWFTIFISFFIIAIIVVAVILFVISRKKDEEETPY